MVITRPVIRLAFCGFPGPFNPDRIQRLLRPHYDLSIDRKNPDYVIYSVFDDEFLDYPNAVRILFTGENVHPDFNLCDYAFGFDWLEFSDRYMRCPNYLLYDQYADLCRRGRTDLTTVPSNRRFCNFIYTNRDAHPIRDEFYHLLSTYRNVDSPGAHLNNTSEPIGAAYQGDWSASKVDYQRDFKFTIAFENSSSPGYTTEKLVHALAADTIPIYWGNPEVGREFNTDRFVNCHAYPSLDAVIQRVQEIDRSEAIYHQLIGESFFAATSPLPGISQEAVLTQFDHIFTQSKPEAIRRNSHFWGARYENNRRLARRAVEFLGSDDWTPRLARRLQGLWVTMKNRRGKSAQSSVSSDKTNV